MYLLNGDIRMKQITIGENIVINIDDKSLVPLKSEKYIPWGCYDIVKKVISSKVFAPIWIAGESGNGKTLGVEQACAAEGRELILINISNETSEEDLIGSYTLTDGNLEWKDGPVIVAMRRGAVLALDEIDQARASIMCLNTIAQGNAYYIKKTNELVYPEPGFTLIGTANTKGDGAGMDKFTGAQIMNEAFLERFSIIFEQQYPTREVEAKILSKETDDLYLIKNLLDISSQIRKSYIDGDLDFNLTTRRLVHIAKNYSIFGDALLSINLAIARFSQDDQEIIRELYLALVKEDEISKRRNNRREETIVPPKKSSTYDGFFDKAVISF